MVRLGIVGGSSLVTFDPTDEFEGIGLKVASRSAKTVDTAYGKVQLKFLELEGTASHTLIFMQRHSHANAKGITAPHKINHLANMRAFADQKVDAIVATASVGTIPACFPPGRAGVCNQYIDFSGKVVTYHEDDAKFTSVTEPFDAHINAVLLQTLRRVQNLSPSTQLEFTYWMSNGPYYESAAEVTAVERLGGHVVGMTSPREAKLCAELGIPYTCLCIASNWAAGRAPGDPGMALCHEEVSAVSAGVTGTVVACLADLLKNGLPDGSRPPPRSGSDGQKCKAGAEASCLSGLQCVVQ